MKINWWSQPCKCYNGCAKLRNNKRVNGSGGNRKETPGKEVEMVRACDEKRGALRRKYGDGNESTGEK